MDEIGADSAPDHVSGPGPGSGTVGSGCGSVGGTTGSWVGSGSGIVGVWVGSRSGMIGSLGGGTSDMAAVYPRPVGDMRDCLRRWSNGGARIDLADDGYGLRVAFDGDLLAAIGPRVRLSPFFESTLAAGLRSVSCYNHMWLPMSYGEPDAEYDRLTTGVSMWDVAAQRHVQIVGPDADEAVQWVTVIDASEVEVGAAAYAPMVDHAGHLVNDPVLLHIGDREWRFSIADSDIRLWVDATARAAGLDCTVAELDTATLAVQGPHASVVMDSLGLGWTRDLPSFRFGTTQLDDITVRICNSGWSAQGGFEFFLDDPNVAGRLWDRVADAGSTAGIGPGAPNPSERIENVLLSYGTDTGYHADPYELGLGDRVDFGCGDFVGRRALAELEQGERPRRLRGLVLDGSRIEPLAAPLAVEAGGELRAAAWSPRFERNLGLALLPTQIEIGRTVEVVGHDCVTCGIVVELPFDDESEPEPIVP